MPTNAGSSELLCEVVDQWRAKVGTNSALHFVSGEQQASLGPLGAAITEFLKVTTSYWPGLFQWYDVAHLPRTDNELEQCFGSVRYSQRRASGRRGASAGLVV